MTRRTFLTLVVLVATMAALIAPTAVSATETGSFRYTTSGITRIEGAETNSEFIFPDLVVVYSNRSNEISEANFGIGRIFPFNGGTVLCQAFLSHRTNQDLSLLLTVCPVFAGSLTDNLTWSAKFPITQYLGNNPSTILTRNRLGLTLDDWTIGFGLKGRIAGSALQTEYGPYLAYQIGPNSSVEAILYGNDLLEMQYNFRIP